MKQLTYVALLFIFFVGCSKNEPPPSEIVARVGKAYLSKDMVEHLLPSQLTSDRRRFFVKRIVEQWIDNQVLAQKALEDGLTLSPGDRWQLQNLKMELLASKFLEKKTQQKFPVTDREIEEYYQANQEEFKRDHDEVHLVHLFFEKPDKVIIREIRQSKSLLEVIRKNYLDRQITKVMEPNGDLGYVITEQLRPEFRRAIRGTKTGLIYGPIYSKDGTHYLQVLDRQPAGSIRSLDLVKETIKAHLEAQKRYSYIKMIKQSARKDFGVETFYDNIL